MSSQTDSNGWIKVPKLRVGTGANGSGTFTVYMSSTARWKHRWKTWAVSFSKGDSSATIGRFAVNFDPILCFEERFTGLPARFRRIHQYSTETEDTWRTLLARVWVRHFPDAVNILQQRRDAGMSGVCDLKTENSIAGIEIGNGEVNLAVGVDIDHGHGDERDHKGFSFEIEYSDISGDDSAVWRAFIEDTHAIDIDFASTCAAVAKAWEAVATSTSKSGPPPSVLRDMMTQKRDAATRGEKMKCMDTSAYHLWKLRSNTGALEPERRHSGNVLGLHRQACAHVDPRYRLGFNPHGMGQRLLAHPEVVAKFHEVMKRWRLQRQRLA